MHPPVIHIFGASGSGTSTLGRCLCDRLGFLFMDTDDYYWLPTDPPYTHKRPPAERVILMKRAIEDGGRRCSGVVISGTFADWGDDLIPALTLAVRLHTDTAVRLERIRRREREKLGDRIDEGGDMFDAHKAFLLWAAAYDTADEQTRSRRKHDEWQTHLTCPLLLLDGGAPLDTNLEAVVKAMTADADA